MARDSGEGTAARRVPSVRSRRLPGRSAARARGPRLAVPLNSRRPRRQTALLALPVSPAVIGVAPRRQHRARRTAPKRTPPGRWTSATTPRPPGWLLYLAIRRPRVCQPV